MYGPAPNIFHSGENRKPPFVGASGGGGGGEANTLQWQERWTAGEVEGGTSDSVTIGGHTLIIHDVGEGETVEAKAFMRPDYFGGDIQIGICWILTGGSTGDTHTFDLGADFLNGGNVPPAITLTDSFSISPSNQNRFFFITPITLTPAGTYTDGSTLLRIKFTRTDSESGPPSLVGIRALYNID